MRTQISVLIVKITLIIRIFCVILAPVIEEIRKDNAYTQVLSSAGEGTESKADYYTLGGFSRSL